MKSHAKASSAGSTEGRGASRGPIVREADATRGSFGDSDGSGAPSRRRARIALSLFAALLALAILAASAIASKDLTTYIGGISGSGAKGGEFNNPRDVAVNESGAGPANPGDTYVADEANNRIERFSSTGAFISAWGANATHRDEVQKLVLNASSGSFTLSFEGDATTPLSYNASSSTVDNALDVLPGIGGDANVNVSSSGAQTYTITFTGALTGTNVGQLTADASELEGTAEVTTTENGSGGGGSDYEICTVAGKCGQALASGGNTTAAGNGTLSAPQSVAVDADTGNVYVSDRGNRRIDEYDGAGAFIRSFGFDTAESGPGNTGTAYEVCNQAEADVCKAGVAGSGAGQYGSGSAQGFGVAVSPADGSASTGSVFLADTANQRIQQFDLEGNFVSMVGGGVIDGGATGTGTVTAASSSVTSVLTTSRAFAVGQTIEGTGIEPNTKIIALGAGTITLSQPANGSATGAGTALTAPTPPGNVSNDEVQELAVSPKTTQNNFKLTFSTPNPSNSSQSTANIPYNASAAQVQSALAALANVGAGNVSVALAPGGNPGGEAEIPGGPWLVTFTGKYADTDVNTLVRGNGSPNINFATGFTISTPVEGASAAETCAAAISDVCRAGAGGASAGPGQFGPSQPTSIAVDSRGILYASSSNNNGDVQRYDTEDADGEGVGFLEPILPPNDEVQKVSFSGFATGDRFQLTCPDGTPTAELAYATGTAVVVGGSVEVGAQILQNGLEEACGTGDVSASGNPPGTTVTFEGALGGSNQAQMTCTKLTGAGFCSVSTLTDGNEGPLLRGQASSATAGLAVDPAEDVLYVLRDPSSGNTVVQQFGPANEPGLSAAPTEADDTHGAEAGFSTVRGLGLNGADGKLYVSATNNVGGLGSAHRVYVLGEGSSLASPSAEMNFVAAATTTARSAAFTGSVNPNGGVVDCRFQYSTDESHWTDVGSAKGTGQLHGKVGIAGPEAFVITSVTATEGAFAVGQTVTSSDGGIKPGTKITAVNSAAGTITLGEPATTEGAVTLTAVGSSACPTLTFNGGSQSIGLEAPGLAPDTDYVARLRVTRPFFPGLAPVTSSVQSFTTDPAAPLLSEAAAKSLDDSSVRVSAKIDPAHSPTVYVVQYGTTPALGSSSAPIEIGEGSIPVEASTVIGGLSASTAYYFKVVATNVTGSASSAGLKTTTFPAPSAFGSCPNDLLRTGPSAHLPDCRAYEQVTPADKTGSDANGAPYGTQASPSGDGIASFVQASFPGGEGFQNVLVLLSHFGAGQWSTAGMQTPPSYGEKSDVQAWTSDLRLSFLKVRDPQAGTKGFSLVMRDNASRAFTVIIPQGVGFGNNYFPHQTVVELAGAFDGDSKVVFAASGEVPVSSGPAPVAPGGNVYLYDRETGELTLAGVLPDSACATPPCVPAEGSEVPGLAESELGPYVQEGHAVSASGDVYFTDFASKQLYLRREAASPGASTVPVSASERTDCADNDPCAGTPEPDPAGTFAPNFAGATPDGAHAFFTSEEELTDEATTATSTEDLYRFDPGAPTGERLSDLAPGAEVRGVLGYSDDGSYVYFAANADLDGAGPASAGNCSGSSYEAGDRFKGKCSLYLWHEGEISFVARLEIDGGLGGSDATNWLGSFFEPETSRVSADGKTLLFRSQRKLTAYDNHGAACEEFSSQFRPGECSEFYRYEAEGGQVECVSCDPSGAAPNSWPKLKNPNLYHAPFSGGGFDAQPFLSRNLSADGKRFFFESPDKLVSRDVNGDVNCSILSTVTETGSDWSCLDVYEWEAPGKGSCSEASGAFSPANGGCIYLLSTGTGRYPSYLADVSESGDTAFIYSRQQLVPSFDEDSLEDIYAVKVNGGLAYQHAVRPAACEGDACRGASSQPSSAPGAGTAAFQGPGDPKQGANKTRCPKGKRQVRRKGKLRCIAKHAKHRRHTKHKRHHKRAANHNRRASR